MTSGGRRGLTLLTAALFVLAVAQALAFGLAAETARRPAAILTAVAAVLVGGLSHWLKREPDRFGGTPIQHNLLRGVLAVAVGVLVAQGPALFGADLHRIRQFGIPAFGLGVSAAGPFFYHALNHWNRSRLHQVSPVDWLNGLSAVLVCAAIANAVLPVEAAHWSHPGTWSPQAAVLGLSVALILTGTALTVISLADLARDPRAWLIAAGMTGLASTAAGGVFSTRSVGWPGAPAGALVAVSLVLLACRFPATTGPARPAGAQSTTQGSIVVIFGGVIMLAFAGGLPRDRRALVAGSAALGVLAVCTRLLRLVHDLEQLALARHQALTDELTGIANRRALMQTLTGRLAEPAAEREPPPVLLIVDVDDFKLVNDRHGHAVGDELLRRLADVLSGAVPDGVLLARLGGDAFAVLLEGLSTADAFDVAQQLVETADRAVDVEGHSLRTRVSVGVAAAGDLPRVLGDDAADGEQAAAGELLRRANMAAHQARTAHLRVSRFDPALDARAREQQRLVEDLQDVLVPGSPRAEQLEAWYQPQVDVATGAVVGAEALVRWRHPELGLLTPDRFIDLVEDHGLMLALTEQVLGRAVRQWARLRDLGRPIRLSVNLSASCLSEPGLFAMLDDATAGRVEPGRLVLEITESAVMADPALAINRMHEMARRGFPISIDDYGTGYSSLSYLSDLPASELKIDRSFTTRLRTDARTRAIVAGTIELAHRLNLRLVAEGVEDEQTLTILRDMRCDEAQGYLHSRPLPASDFESWLLARKTVPTFVK